MRTYVLTTTNSFVRAIALRDLTSLMKHTYTYTIYVCHIQHHIHCGRKTAHFDFVYIILCIGIILYKYSAESKNKNIKALFSIIRIQILVVVVSYIIIIL